MHWKCEGVVVGVEEKEGKIVLYDLYEDRLIKVMEIR